jgi:hypothetical protein
MANKDGWRFRTGASYIVAFWIWSVGIKLERWAYKVSPEFHAEIERLLRLWTLTGQLPERHR